MVRAFLVLAIVSLISLPATPAYAQDQETADAALAAMDGNGGTYTPGPSNSDVVYDASEQAQYDESIGNMSPPKPVIMADQLPPKKIAHPSEVKKLKKLARHRAKHKADRKIASIKKSKKYASRSKLHAKKKIRSAHNSKHRNHKINT